MLQTLSPGRKSSSKLPARQPVAIEEQRTDKASVILQQLEWILADQEEHWKLLTQQGSLAQALLDLLQMLSDYPDIDKKVHSRMSTAMIRLSKNSGLYPGCLALNNIEKIGDHPVAGGGFGEIWKGRLGGQLTCLKVVKVYGNSDVQRLMKEFLKEAILWRQLEHPNVLPFLGLYFLDATRERICLISPWMENGNLTQYLKDNSELADRVILAYDVACGLTYLHEKKIIHGDLKGVNILVTASGRATIGDFGLSRLTESDPLPFSSTTNAPGTARWLAPECLISHQRASYPSDVYAFGCVCYEIFTNRLPFYQFAHDAAIVIEFAKGNRPIRLPQIDDDVWLIMQDCWNQDPSERPVANALPTRFAAVLNGGISQAEDWHNTSISRLWHNVQYPELCSRGSELEKFLRLSFLRSVANKLSFQNEIAFSSYFSEARVFYATVVHSSKRESSHELDARCGDAIVVVAILNREWFIAKPIGRPGQPGIISVSFVELCDLETGNAIHDVDDLVVNRKLVGNNEDKKHLAVQFGGNDVVVTIADFDLTNKLSVWFSHHPTSEPTTKIIYTASVPCHWEKIYPWACRPLVLSYIKGSPRLIRAIAQEKSPSPFPRYGHSLLASDTNPEELYMFGGQPMRFTDAAPGNDFYVFNIRNLSARLVKTRRKPAGRSAHASVMLRQMLITWGGRLGSQDKFMTDGSLYVLDVASRVWTRMSVSGPIPAGRYGHSACLVQGSHFVVFGGVNVENVFFNDLWSVDLTNISNGLKWQLIEPTNEERPRARAAHVCVTQENQIIIFGGSDGSSNLNDTWCFDFETREWTEWKCDGQIPHPRNGHTAALVDSIMYTFGGRDNDGNESPYVFALSLSSRIWYSFRHHDMGCPPGERLGHAMASVGPEIYVVGGRSISLPFSIAMESPTYMHVLDTRQLSLEYSDFSLV